MFKRLIAFTLTALALVSIAHSQATIPLKGTPVRTSADVLALAQRWINALLAGWQSGTINTAPILSQYAPDGAVAFRSKPGSGFATGSTLLATLEKTPLNTDAQRNQYFQGFLLNKPQPTLSSSVQTRLLSKDVATLSGPWNIVVNNGTTSRTVNARVTMVWKRYPKVTVNGQTYKYQWFMVEMHSSANPN